MLFSHFLINTQVVDVKCFDIRENAVVKVLLKDAKAITPNLDLVEAYNKIELLRNDLIAGGRALR